MCIRDSAWDVFLTATFENGLLPGIRLESVREDPPNSFQEARIRAKKHEANNQRCFHPHPPYCIRCRAFWTSSAAKHGLIQYCYHQRSSRGNIQAEVGGETAHDPYYQPRRTNQAGSHIGESRKRPCCPTASRTVHLPRLQVPPRHQQMLPPESRPS